MQTSPVLHCTASVWEQIGSVLLFSSQEGRLLFNSGLLRLMAWGAGSANPDQRVFLSSPSFAPSGFWPVTKRQRKGTCWVWSPRWGRTTSIFKDASYIFFIYVESLPTVVRSPRAAAHSCCYFRRLLPSSHVTFLQIQAWLSSDRSVGKSIVKGMECLDHTAEVDLHPASRKKETFSSASEKKDQTTVLASPSRRTPSPSASAEQVKTVESTHSEACRLWKDQVTTNPKI